jgi:large subunit ribosomal protein L30e
MELDKLIKEKTKEGKVLLGYKSVIKLLKSDKPELVVVANNIRDDKKKMIEQNAQISKVQVKEYQKDNINLGLLCGKPFSVSALVVKRDKK